MIANRYINIAKLYKRMPVLTDTDGDHLIAVSDLRTAIAMAAAETGEVHPVPCKIGDKVYTVLCDDITDEHIVDELTVTEVGINGLFVSAARTAGDDFGDYLPYSELGDEWYLGREDACKERDRRDELNESSIFDMRAIEEMESDIAQSGMLDCPTRCRIVAEELYFKDYRKQRTAQWVTSAEIEEGVTLSYTHRCTDCNYFYKTVCPRGDNYCHKCGAKMKGGE